MTWQNKQTTFMNSLFNFTTQLRGRLLSVGRYSTARCYLTSVRQFLKFLEKDDFTLSEITPELLKRFERSLLARKCELNTISMYMRMLRSIYNQAVEEGLAPYAPKLFNDVFTGNDTTEKRAVSPNVISQLKDADLSERPALAMSRDLFLLSFYLRGIPFVDLIRLRKSDLRRNMLHYHRSKTGTQLTVQVEPCARELLLKYASSDKNSPFLLSIITQEGARGYVQYQSALRKYNSHLNKLSLVLQLKVRLTSYVARHSWATAAYHRGISVSVICESLGHSSEKVTYTYLTSFGHKTLGSANRKVIALLSHLSRSQKDDKRVHQCCREGSKQTSYG